MHHPWNQSLEHLEFHTTEMAPPEVHSLRFFSVFIHPHYVHLSSYQPLLFHSNVVLILTVCFQPTVKLLYNRSNNKYSYTR